MKHLFSLEYSFFFSTFFLLFFYFFFFCCSFVVLADYPAPPLPKQGGGRFSNAVVPSETEVLMRRAEQIPGPSEYTVTIIFNKFFFIFLKFHNNIFFTR